MVGHSSHTDLTHEAAGIGSHQGVHVDVPVEINQVNSMKNYKIGVGSIKSQLSM